VETDSGVGLSHTFFIARMDRTLALGIDWADVNFRYKDVSALVTWDGDLYGPRVAVDFAGLQTQAFAPWLTWTFTGIGGWPDNQYNKAFDLTAMVRDGLLSTETIYTLWYVKQESTQRSVTFAWTYNPGGAGIVILVPYFDILYFLPLEFYAAKVDGTVNLAQPLDAYMGMDAFRLYLSAVQRGETGQPVKAFLKNYTALTHKLLRVGDDVPEAADPVKNSGSGTGYFTHVELAEAAVSQEYWIKFTSATAYDVKALRFRDNQTDLHASYGGSGWTGDITSDFNAPTGGLTIPVEAWSLDGFLTNDIYVVQVLGNTTDTGWPADSNDQVQMTLDNAGAPDDTKWRPVQGYSVRTAAAVTVDATLKVFPVKPFVAAQFQVGTKAWVGDVTPKLQQGHVEAGQEASLGAVTFGGTGLNDFSKGGNYRGIAELTYVAKIDGTGTPDTFKWSDDGGSTWDATTVNCSTSWVHLNNGVYVKWAASTGHTVDDQWSFLAKPWAITLDGLTNNSDVFAAGSWLSTALPATNCGPATWAQGTAAFGVSQANPKRIPIADPAAKGFTTSSVVYLQDLDDGELYEEGTIQTVGTSYIDLAANMTNDYVTASVVLKKGSGEWPFWLRAVATMGTAEQRKDLRINVKV
jgi:hypothetical protein